MKSACEGKTDHLIQWFDRIVLQSITVANMSVQYTALFHGCKNDNFQMIFFYIFFYFCSKHRLWVHVRTASARRF